VSDSGHVRCEFIFRGTVQGVGFRYTTNRIAEGHDVTGWVMNKPDRTVQCVVEGAPDVIKAFVFEVQETMAGYIVETTECRTAASGSFSDFKVRYD